MARAGGAENARSFTLREFRSDDAEDIRRLHVAAILATPPELYTREQREAWASGKEARIYVELHEQGQPFIVAADAVDRAIGFCHFAGEEIKGLYVDPHWQGQGVGTALLNNAERALRAQGVTEITIHSGLPGLPFYIRHGYEIISHHEHKTRSGVALETRMLRKQLQP